MSIKSFLLDQVGSPSGWFAPVVAWIFNTSNKRHNVETVAALDLEPNWTVIDLGFGGGASLPALLGALPHGHVLGVEPSREMIKRGEKRYSEAVGEERLELRAGSAEEIPARDGSIDAVLTVNTVYFWSDLASGLSEVLRVLRVGGRLAVGVGDPATLRKAGFVGHGHRVFETGELSDLLVAAGFAGVHVHTYADRGQDRHVVLGSKPEG